MQLSYPQNMPMARSGALADLGPNHIMPRIAHGEIAQGRGVFRVPSVGAPGMAPSVYPGGVWQNPNVSIAADVDAIATTVAGADPGVILGPEDFNGVLGADEVFPPRRMTVTTNSNANWDADATGLTLSFVDHLGVTREEVKAVADAGNETHTTTAYVRQPLGVEFSATSMVSAAATFTVGYAALDSSITAADFIGIAVLDDRTIESAYGVTTVEDDAVYQANATLPVLESGHIWVRTENACTERGAAYVRIASGAGGSDIGAIRGTDTDTSTAILIPNAYFCRDSGVGGLNILRLV